MVQMPWLSVEGLPDRAWETQERVPRCTTPGVVWHLRRKSSVGSPLCARFFSCCSHVRHARRRLTRMFHEAPKRALRTFALADVGGDGGQYGRPKLGRRGQAEQGLPECSCPRGERALGEAGRLAVPAGGGCDGRCGAGGAVWRLDENMEGTATGCKSNIVMRDLRRRHG